MAISLRGLLPIIALAAATMTAPPPRAASLSSCEEYYSSPVTQAALSSADNIFFLRMTNESTLSTIERCALVSAVLLNPQKRVNIFSNSISCDLLQSSVFTGVHLIRFDLASVYEGTPFAEWYQRRDWDMGYRGIHLSDSFRLVLLYRFGGIYLDTDVVSYRSFDGIGVSVGLEDPWVINNAVMSFTPRHSFVDQLMHNFVLRFRNDVWGWNGPRLLTRVWMKHFTNVAETDITLAGIDEFYPISWRNGDWKRFLAHATSPEVKTLLQRTRVVHFWHGLLISELETSIQSDPHFFDTIAGQIMFASCPNLHVFADRREPPAAPQQILLDSADPLWLSNTPVVEVSDGLVQPVSYSLHGIWEQNKCGFLGTSIGVNEIALPVPSRYWSLSFWLNTFLLDATSRLWPHHTPPTQPFCIPHCEFGIPAIPLRENALASKYLSASGDVLILSLEQGHFAVGNSSREWSRTVSSISDGRWHHISVSLSPASEVGVVVLHVVLDGILHIEDIRVQTPFTQIVFGSPNTRGDLYIDKLGIFEHPFTVSETVRVRNAQLLASTQTRCWPAMPWMGAPVEDRNDARIITLIMSDTRLSSVAERMAVRTSWLALAAKPRRHVFCVGSGGFDSLLALEAVQYGDLVRVAINDDYQHLSEKVFSCLTRTQLQFRDTYDFLIKTDQDVFLRADVLQEELSAVLLNHQNSATGALLHWQGFAYKDMPPMRDLSDKNADTINPIVTFPPYTAGVGYILSETLVLEIVALRNPVFCLNEDQALGLWVKQRGSFGGLHIKPIHDIRFQQWETCYKGQIALHLSESHVRRARLAVYNIREGLEMCANMQLSSCCLCCDCHASKMSWFSCSREGAFLSSYVPLSSIIDTASLEIDISTSPTTLVAQISQTTAVECPFELGKWRALGIARLYPGSLGGVVFTCPRDVSYDGKEPSSFCAASVVAKPGRSREACASMPEFGEIFESVGRFETSSTFGEHSEAFNYRCEESHEEERESLTWLFVSATVNTMGACSLDHLDPRLRQALVTKADYEISYYGPPYYGSFAAFCGLVIDVHHSDGTTSTLRSAFARNASAHLHYQIFRVFNAADIDDIVINIIQPSFPTSMSVVQVFDIKLLRFNKASEPLDSYVLDVSRTTASELTSTDPRKTNIFFHGPPARICLPASSHPVGLIWVSIVVVCLAVLLFQRLCRLLQSCAKTAKCACEKRRFPKQRDQ